MSWPDAQPALASGAVEGQENPLHIFTAAKLHTLAQKYVTMWDYVADPLIFVVNRDIWNSFTPADREIVRAAAVEAGKQEVAIARKGLTRGDMSMLKDVEALGVKVTQLTDAERGAFEKAVRPVTTNGRNRSAPTSSSAPRPRSPRARRPERRADGSARGTRPGLPGRTVSAPALTPTSCRHVRRPASAEVRTARRRGRRIPCSRRAGAPARDWIGAAAMALLALITFANVVARYFTLSRSPDRGDLSQPDGRAHDDRGRGAVLRDRHPHRGDLRSGSPQRRRLAVVGVRDDARLPDAVTASLRCLGRLPLHVTSPGIGVPQWWYDLAALLALLIAGAARSVVQP